MSRDGPKWMKQLGKRALASGFKPNGQCICGAHGFSCFGDGCHPGCWPQLIDAATLGVFIEQVIEKLSDPSNIGAYAILTSAVWDEGKWTIEAPIGHGKSMGHGPTRQHAWLVAFEAA